MPIVIFYPGVDLALGILLGMASFFAIWFPLPRIPWDRILTSLFRS